MSFKMYAMFLARRRLLAARVAPAKFFIVENFS
jgi:hypothetical protein